MDDDLIREAVDQSLIEDIGNGDITALLIDPNQIADAEVIFRNAAVVCGIAWFDQVYYQIDRDVNLQWQVTDGQRIEPNQCAVKLHGKARSLVTGERCALNWLQFLSGIATQVSHCVAVLAGANTVLLDTRKTIPGLRHAQKYAVRIGGGQNHRMGLYDAYLIKENHIASCGSILAAVTQARALLPDRSIEVEVENLIELEQAVMAGANRIMLDNFSVSEITQAVSLTRGRAELEVSGNVNIDQLRDVASTGVDYVSMGSLTKDIKAADLSMRFSGVS